VDIKKIPQMDAVFIRARTDPLNVTYVASRMAESCGIPVIDDPASIRICSDKVNMSASPAEGIAIPRTSSSPATRPPGQEIFSGLGCPLVLKEPSTSFSLRVEKVTDPEQFMKVASRFFRMSDWIVVQEFVESRYDWRVGVLDGELLYVCKYTIPEATFKIQDSVNGHMVFCRVESVPAKDAPAPVVEMGIAAGNAIGNGLYGVDLKTTNGDCCVIESTTTCRLRRRDIAYPAADRIISHLLGK
jgi:glutathione synthase/RimK-type ligase-like ATP-grasp enzyme